MSRARTSKLSLVMVFGYLDKRAAERLVSRGLLSVFLDNGEVSIYRMK